MDWMNGKHLSVSAPYPHTIRCRNFLLDNNMSVISLMDVVYSSNWNVVEAPSIGVVERQVCFDDDNGRCGYGRNIPTG